MAEILGACDAYQQKHPKAGEANALRLRALVLLLRYSGLRIRDAVTLERGRITDGKLFLYQAKTGTAVYCPLPPFVVEVLEALPGEKYFSGPANQTRRARLATGNALCAGCLS